MPRPRKETTETTENKEPLSLSCEGFGVPQLLNFFLQYVGSPQGQADIRAMKPYQRAEYMRKNLEACMHYVATFFKLDDASKPDALTEESRQTIIRYLRSGT